MDKKILSPETGSHAEVKAFEMTELNPKKGVFRTPTLDSKRIKPVLPVSVDASRKKPSFQLDEAVGDLIADEVDDSREEEIEARVNERLAAIKEEAEREATERGYAEGVKRGEAQGLSQLEETIRERSAALEEVTASLESLRADLYRVNERFLLETVMRVCRSILQKEIDSDSEYVARLLRAVIERVGTKERLKVLVNASRLESLYAILPELEKRHSTLKNISIEASPRLESHDVVIETDWNKIDATLDAQIASFRELLLEEESDRPVEGDEG